MKVITTERVTAKTRYWAKKLSTAKIISCACGCNQELKEFDNYGRRIKFINGHNGRKYADPTQHKREWNHRNRESRYELKASRHRRLKVALINLNNNKCADCSSPYDGSNAAIFHFHHNDPSTKTFAVGNKLTNYSWSRILAESAKCSLLCANCHEMRHSSRF